MDNNDHNNVSKDIMNVVEIAEYLQLSQSIVRRLIKEKGIPHLRIKRRYLFYLPRVQQWLEEISCEPTCNLTKEADITRQRSKELWNATAAR